MTEEITAAEYRDRIAESPRVSKYRNVRTTVDGITFDSAAEARRYVALRLMARAGEITDVQRQRRYPLVVNGVTVGTYVADFVYVDRDGTEHVEDVKGVRTPVYKLKRRLMNALYGIDIEEVTGMKSYRCKVEAYVVVEAANQKAAKARAEWAVRDAVRDAYRSDDDRYADAWDGFGFHSVGRAEPWDEDGEGVE